MPRKMKFQKNQLEHWKTAFQEHFTVFIICLAVKKNCFLDVGEDE
jgi:hypothetical protein